MVPIEVRDDPQWRAVLQQVQELLGGMLDVEASSVSADKVLGRVVSDGGLGCDELDAWELILLAGQEFGVVIHVAEPYYANLLKMTVAEVTVLIVNEVRRGSGTADVACRR